MQSISRCGSCQVLALTTSSCMRLVGGWIEREGLINMSSPDNLVAVFGVLARDIISLFKQWLIGYSYLMLLGNCVKSLQAKQ